VLGDAILDREIEGGAGSMPELPEVEITRRAVAPFLEGKKVVGVVAREVRLRFPLPAPLSEELPGHTILKLERRAKYLLLRKSISGFQVAKIKNCGGSMIFYNLLVL
jgi:hypothetical protein